MTGFAVVASAAELQLALNQAGNADHEQERHHVALQHTNSADQAWQFHHDYRVFALPADDMNRAASNGHVHQLSVMFSLQQETRHGYHWQGYLQPVIATSSNALRARRLHGDDLRWHGAVQLRHDSDSNIRWLAGACTDDRLGQQQLYPCLSAETGSANDWSLALGWPDNRWRWRFADAWQLQAYLTPAGGQWHVYDDARDRDSTLRYRQWQLGWQLQWQPSVHWQLTFGLQREFEQRLRYRLANGQAVTRHSDDSTTLVVGTAIQF